MQATFCKRASVAYVHGRKSFLTSKLVEGCDELAIKLVIADGFNLAGKILSDIKLVTTRNDCDTNRVKVRPEDILAMMRRVHETIVRHVNVRRVADVFSH